MKNLLLTVAGFLLLLAGAIGILIPVWPTTPFVLVAIACFSGNPKMRRRLLQNPFIRDHYLNYKNRCGLKKKNVLISLFALWAVLLLSILAVKTGWVMVLLPCVGLAVTAHLLIMAKPGARP